MREMKDSGIEWIGEIPAGWKCCKQKYEIQLINGRAYSDSEFEEDGKYRILRVGNLFSNPVWYTSSMELSADKYCSFGDLLYSWSMSYAPTIWTGEKVIYHYHIWKVLLSNDLQKKFAFYYLTSLTDALKAEIHETTMGFITMGIMNNSYIAIPNTEEQTRIANFLDSKCAEIDALTADIQAEINILEQYKKSVITEAVTKGLDPNVEMKDSGIAWCPLIPSHWEYSNPKALFKQRTDRAFPNEKQLTSSQEYGIIYQDEYMELTGNRIVTVIKDFSILKHVEPNDFVISMRSFQGGLEYSEKRGSISSAYIMLIPNEKYVYAPFYRWFFKSSKYINAIQSTSNLVRDGQAMRYANFAQVPLFIIPLDEQKSIAEYLDNKIGEIDYILSEKKRQVGTLLKYKKSLIYEYVTGKKEVPATNTNAVIAINPQAILLGGIVKRIGNSQHSRTQLQKLLYLCNTHLGMNQNIQYYRYEHGPYDVHLNEYIRELVKNQWFNEKSQDKNCLLVSGKKWQEFEQNYPNPFGEKKKEISELFKQLKNLSTKQIERIATLYAAWNDFLLDGVTPSDDQIIQDVVTNWTENKANFKHSTWQESLNQMKQFGLIPKGTGLHTLPKPEKGGLNNE